MAMEPDLTYWMIAWLWMALAFAGAFLAILIGAHGLDRISRNNMRDTDIKHES
jgi:hypothetical protein